ncbi:MAG TPA: DUF72 domain-containing protein [Abditibacteriaceae bacterium]|jgi:uncharacterized protein YecE (DUF72 family)
MRTPQFHIGTSGWKYDDWKGVFLPRTGDELAAYARVFSTVEIDSTWYHTPAPKVVASWARRVPEGFRFSAKVPREITHDKLLINCEDALNSFLDSMSELGEARGPLLLQFPPTWSLHEGWGALHQFLPLLREGAALDWQFAVEFRHRSWFGQRTAELLQEFNVAWTLADFGAWWHKEEMPLFVTADFAYVRWLGNRYEELEPFDALKKDKTHDEERWLETLGELPVNEVWGYFNNHWAGFSPASARDFLEKLGTPAPEFSVVAPPVKPGSGQGSLFD